MSLKDVIADDIDSVFFNTGEFAETVVIDGREIPIIRDADTLSGKSEVYALGLMEGEELIFAKEKDFSSRPQPGDQLTMDGKQWYIRHCVSNMGIYELRIARKAVASYI